MTRLDIQKIFQYILCYGSTAFSAATPALKIISIHPMLRFNIFNNVDDLPVVIFQYILCYGSTI